MKLWYLLPILALAACNGQSPLAPNDPTAREATTPDTLCREIFLNPVDSQIADTSSDTSLPYLHEGHLWDTAASSIIPHSYLDSSTGNPYACPYGGNPAPYLWQWPRDSTGSCENHAVKTLKYACPIYIVYLPVVVQ